MEPYVLPFCLNPNFGVTRRVNGKERCSKWSLCISTRVVGGLLAACYTPPPTKHHHPFKLSCQHDHETRCWVCTDLHFSPKNQDVGEGQHLVFVKESVGYSWRSSGQIQGCLSIWSLGNSLRPPSVWSGPPPHPSHPGGSPGVPR